MSTKRMNATLKANLWKSGDTITAEEPWHDLEIDYETDEEITVNITISFDYSPWERQTHYYPGADASVEVTKIMDENGKDLSDILDEVSDAADILRADLEAACFAQVASNHEEEEERRNDYKNDR